MTIRNSTRAVFPERGWFELLREAVTNDTELAVIGRWCTLDLVLVAGKETVLLRFEGGRVAEVILEPDISASWSVTLRGTREDWLTFLQPVPPPFYQDLLSMNGRVPSFSIEGDRKVFVRHLHALARIFRIAQEIGGGRA
ncbi:MAG: hypothetical protein LC781_10965 [Actinobacteria bacterium]|nr:hypothetical protein [Rubrobacter sp.]MCA1717317.1 hypothetical protein [Actinomycetota bacterium]MDQ3636736.1 hypothetical protein [Actinomycetota bacterium]